MLATLTERPRALVVVDRGDTVTWLSLRNLEQIHVLAVDQLNTYDVLASDDVIFTKAAFDTFVATAVDGGYGASRRTSTETETEPKAKTKAETDGRGTDEAEAEAEAETEAATAEVRRRSTGHRGPGGRRGRRGCRGRPRRG